MGWKQLYAECLPTLKWIPLIGKETIEATVLLNAKRY